MTDETQPPATAGSLPLKKRRPFGKLAIGVALGVAAWTGGWYYIKGEVVRRMDIELGKLDGRGIVVSCPDRDVSGWPFRIVVTCANPSLIAAGGLSADAAAVTVTGLVYRPNHVIVDIAAPFHVKRGDTRMSGNWRDLTASVSLDKGHLGRFSIVSDDFVGKFSPEEGIEQELRFASGEAHLMPDPDKAIPEGLPPTAYLLATTLRGASAFLNGKSQIPVPVTAKLDAGVDPLPPAGLADPHQLASVGTKLTVHTLDIDLGDVALNASGGFGVTMDGRIDGRLEMQSVAPAAPSGQAEAKSASPIKAALAGMFLFMSASGKSTTGREGPRLDFIVEQGRMKFGKMPLGTLKPLF